MADRRCGHKWSSVNTSFKAKLWQCQLPISAEQNHSEHLGIIGHQYATWYKDGFGAIHSPVSREVREKVDPIDPDGKIERLDTRGLPSDVSTLLRKKRNRAAKVATQEMPHYIGRWIAGTLLEAHTLGALLNHQDSIAEDILYMFGED